MKIALASLPILAAAAISANAWAGEPVKDIDPKLHPHLAAAQEKVVEAYNQLKEAQVANEFDMAGHAQKAKEMLDRVNVQIKDAAMAANKAKKEGK